MLALNAGVDARDAIRCDRMSVWDELTREEQVRIGRRAQAILNDEAFILATREAEKRLVAEWKECADPEEREGLWARVKGLAEVAHQLRALQDSGAVAE